MADDLESVPQVEAPKLPRAIPFAPSSQIASITYDDSAMELTVAFQRGGVYVYRQVPSDVVDSISQAPSAGKYFNSFIKDQYAYERVG
jgi:lysyl-tRNA synthetase, class II